MDAATGASSRAASAATSVGAVRQPKARATAAHGAPHARPDGMIRKLPSGEYRLYSRKVDPKTGRRRNLGTFPTRKAAEKHERAIQYFKRH